MKLLVLVFISTLLFSNEFKPVMIFDTDLILDNSWNETIYNGIKKFEKKTNENVKIINIKTEKYASIGSIESLAKDGYNPIVLSYTEYRNAAFKKVMANYPLTRFIIINGTFDMPNAHYISFAYQEISFLAGYLAMKKSKTKKIGFVGGADVLIIKDSLCGYIKGAKYANKDAQIEYEYIGKDFSAFTNPSKAYELTLKQIENGADVIFAPAGQSTLGALKGVDEKNVYGIGADSNQNHLYPGSVLTSAMVRVDNAVFRALMAAKNNIWGPQIKVMGLQEQALQLAFDKYNKELVSVKLRSEINTVTADILLKKIDLQPYSEQNQCTYNGEVLF